MNAPLLAACLLLFANAARAGDETVSNCANDAELRADLAAMQASGGGTLQFACPGGTPPIVLSATLPTISTATVVDGVGTVTLSGGNAFRHFVVDGAGALTLRRITIANGLAATDGGAVRSSGSLVVEDARFEGNQCTTQSGGAILALGPLTIRRSTFVDNVAVNGGALYPRFPPAVVTIEDSSFQGNQATGTTQGSGLGGAILAWDGAQVTITRTTFTGNSAFRGGAYYNTSNSTLVLRQSTVASNQPVAFGIGGGLFNDGTASIEASLFTDNVASNAAAIRNIGTLGIVNSTLSGNRQGPSSGVLLNSGSLSLLNTTLRGNVPIALAQIGTVTGIRNTVIDHEGGDCIGCTACEGTVPSSGFNLATDTSCNFTQAGDRQNVPSGLGPLADNGGPTLTHLPSGASLLVDGGTVADCPGTDQRGVARPVGLSCDIGAVEAGLALFANGFE